MYKSPIETIKTEIQTQFENDCIKAVQSYGFMVNKEELIKALNYDREQYEKGYSDGYSKAVEDIQNREEEKYCPKIPTSVYA